MTSSVSAVAISPDGRLLTSGSGDSIVKLWNLATGSCHVTLEGHSDGVFAMDFPPDGQLVASGGDSIVRLWNVATGFGWYTLEDHSYNVIDSNDFNNPNNHIRAVIFSPNSQLVASSSFDFPVRLRDVVTGSCCSTLEGHLDIVRAVAFLPDSQLVTSRSIDKTVWLWDATTGSCHSTLGTSHRVQAVASFQTSHL